MKRIRIQKRSPRRAAGLVVFIAVASLVVPVSGAWAYDPDYPIDDPVDCEMYGGWDFGPGVHCSEEPDEDWVDNDVAYIQNVVENVTPEPQPSASPTPTPSAEPTPSPSETPRDKPGKGPKK